jgi:hypothetical protein
MTAEPPISFFKATGGYEKSTDQVTFFMGYLLLTGVLPKTFVV